MNKEATKNKPNNSFIRKLLISEHSPIRSARIRWKWHGIPSWVSVHFARHWLGWEKWVGTQRSDRTGVNRNEIPQNAPVDMTIEANAQALINVSRYRLCNQASPETRAQMVDLKKTLHLCGQEELADVMQPNCVYRCGCSEFQSCGRWEAFCQRHKDIDMTNIQERYDASNSEYYQ